MQVSCSSCGAKYEFDASAIPAAGYDAQCTTCNAIFFVSPDADGPAKPQAAMPPTVGLRLGEQVAVSCNHCGAVYQFAATDIPQEGYDAQCTQCQGVFFVSAAGAAQVQAPSAKPALQSFEQALADPVAPPEPSAPLAPQAQPPQTEPAAAAPTGFSAAPQDIPLAAEDDYASMSQVIAMERLEAKQRESQAQTTSSAPAATAHVPDAPDAPLAATPAGPITSRASLQHLGSGESAAVPDAATANIQAPAAEALAADAASPDLNPVPSWGIAAPEMAALSGEPESVAAPAAALAASEPVPPSAAETGVGMPPHGFVANPQGQVPVLSTLESFSISSPSAQVSPATQATDSARDLAAAVAGADEPPAPPAPSDDASFDAPQSAAFEPAATRPTAASHLSFDDASYSADEQTSTDIALPKKGGRWLLAAGVVGALGLGWAAYGVWRSGALVTQGAEQLATAAQAAADNAAAQAPQAALAPAPEAAAKVVSPKARVAFERGMHSLLEDTTAGYTTAQEAFREALKIEPDMVDAYAGLSLQALLAGEDALSLGHAEWAEAKRLEGVAASHQAKLLSPMPRGRHQKEFERERMHALELGQQVSQVREKAMLHLQMGEDTLQSGAMLVLRGSMMPSQTPLMRTSMALWLASDPYVANPGEASTTLVAARNQFTEAAQWLWAPGEETAGASMPKGADSKDPYARTWLSLAKARILAAKPTTAVQVQPFLESTIAREPHFMRGRWEIARALDQAGQKQAAQKAAEALVQVMPSHEKAKALLDSLKTAESPATAPQAAPAQDKPAPNTLRSRGHKQRRR